MLSRNGVMRLAVATVALTVTACLGESFPLADAVVANDWTEPVIVLIAHDKQGQSAEGWMLVPNDGNQYRTLVEEMTRGQPGEIVVMDTRCRPMFKQQVGQGKYLVTIDAAGKVTVQAVDEYSGDTLRAGDGEPVFRSC